MTEILERRARERTAVIDKVRTSIRKSRKWYFHLSPWIIIAMALVVAWVHLHHYFSATGCS